MVRTWVVASMFAVVSVISGCGGGSGKDPEPDNPDNPDQPDNPDDGSGQLDADGDGVKAQLDCDDHDPSVYPGAPELCDFKPNGCGAAVSEAGTAAFVPKAGAVRDMTAMLKAGTMDAPATVDFNEAGTLNVCSGTFFVSLASEATSLTLRGAGAKATILSGGRAARILTMVPDDATLDISRVTLQDGFSDNGAAIVGDGTLTIADAAFTGNVVDAAAPDGWGGAIFWIGAATVRDTTFTGNVAATAGGAIGVQGSLTLRTSELDSNLSMAGGGVAVLDGTVLIESVQLHDNRALQEGGAVFLQDATSTLRNVTMLRNNATVTPDLARAFGGGIALLSGRATIEDCTIANGRSSTGGAGLFINHSDVVIKRSTVRANESLHFNGLNPSVFSGFGAGLEIIDSKARVEDSTIADNQGRWGFGVFIEHDPGSVSTDVTFVNTTFGGNRNILGEAASASLEYWRANFMQPVLVSGAVSFHCDNVGCAMLP
jgi:predicted outer membrane repeat protein